MFAVGDGSQLQQQRGISTAFDGVDDRARAEAPGSKRVTNLFQIGPPEFVEQVFRAREIAMNEVLEDKSDKGVLQPGLVADLPKQRRGFESKGFGVVSSAKTAREHPRDKICAGYFW